MLHMRRAPLAPDHTRGSTIGFVTHYIMICRIFHPSPFDLRAPLARDLGGPVGDLVLGVDDSRPKLSTAHAHGRQEAGLLGGELDLTHLALALIPQSDGFGGLEGCVVLYRSTNAAHKDISR